MEGISLEEGVSADEKKNLELMETRKRIIEWAVLHDLGDEDWVDETFEFQPEGTAICMDDLNLVKTYRTRFAS